MCEAIDSNMRVLQRYAFGAISVLDDLVLLGQQCDASYPARRQHPIAVPFGAPEHRFGMARDIDRQRFLHRSSRDVGSRDLVVLAIVAEKVLREGAVEYFTELFGHLEIGFDID